MMKKILVVMMLAMVLVWGVGVQQASATYWTPTQSGMINVNYVGTSHLFAIFDDLDSNLQGSHLELSGGTISYFDTISFVQNGSGYDLYRAGSATGFTLAGSSTFQIGWYDTSTSSWKIDTSCNGDGNLYEIFWNYSTGASASASIVQIDAAPAVPIPAAVWLLGSGLLGLVGIRRRSNKEEQ